MKIIKVIIPAFNEQNAIANVITEIPNIVNEIIVVSNNSTDDTIKVATNAGVRRGSRAASESFRWA